MMIGFLLRVLESAAPTMVSGRARGFKVGVVERGPLMGREQEWNISEAELEEMVEADVLSKQARFGCLTTTPGSTFFKGFRMAGDHKRFFTLNSTKTGSR